jgi:hypothetical protein
MPHVNRNFKGISTVPFGSTAKLPEGFQLPKAAVILGKDMQEPTGEWMRELGLNQSIYLMKVNRDLA